ncbi:MAG: TetR/AcrR family transcriptional regulator [Alphaproteobacteria bacterium]
MNIDAKKKLRADLERDASVPDYAASLKRAAGKRIGGSKRARTRAKLKLATFMLMRRDGVDGLKVTSVTKEAAVAAGTFYSHFESLDDLVREVVEEFFEMEARSALPLGPGEEPFDAMKAGFLNIVRLFRTNIMIFKSLENIRVVDPLLRKIWIEFDNRWARQFAQITAKKAEPEGIDGKLAIMLGHAALAMVDEVLFRIFFDRYDDLLALGDDDETIAELMAVFRYRLLLAANPPAEKLTVTRGLIGRNVPVSTS